MQSTTTRSELRSPSVQPVAPRRAAAPVRLPQATADLVNRMLAARCGAGR